jgi:hypothetical protein
MQRALRFAEGVVVEVARGGQPGEPVAGAAAISKKFRDVMADMPKILTPLIAHTAEAINNGVESCEIEVAFSFTAEGTLFLCKAGGEASVTVKARLRSPG